MARRDTKITDYKTKRINTYTGGIIGLYQIPNYPVTDTDDGILHNSFITHDNVYIGDYAQGWWYFKKNMLVCFEHPNNVGIVLKRPAKDYEYLEDYKTDGRVGGDDIEGYYGYSHRGGSLIKIGDRIFDEEYIPRAEDYTKKEWAEFQKKYNEYVVSEVKNGYFKTEELARKSLQIADIVPFIKRGPDIITNWEQAKEAAYKLGKSLS